MGLDLEFWRGKRVFITGHTGFKGAWLSLLLIHLGADVTGFAQQPITEPNLFEVLNLAPQIKHHIGDIRHANHLVQCLADAQPDVVIHLAAQSLVKYSYQHPAETFEVNVNGTLNLLEALRHQASQCAALVVTSDKCYLNQEQGQAFTESDALGGKDPYSASKACTELLTLSYLESFFTHGSCQIATARAGNVIGGGDWSQNRLVPDIIQACLNQEPVALRYPQSTRPWQHVLEALGGYLMLIEKLYQTGKSYCGPWNFGPTSQGQHAVAWVTEYLGRRLAPNMKQAWFQEPGHHDYEAATLALDITKAQQNLNWKPSLNLEETLDLVAEWYIAYQDHEDMLAFTLKQIQYYLDQCI